MLIISLNLPIKYQKNPRYLRKIKNGWNGTQSIKNHVILLKMKTTISHEFLPKLPICDSVEEIKLLIRNNQFLIIEGETGSGKQHNFLRFVLRWDLPHKVLLESLSLEESLHALLRAIASEMDSKVGDFVGWQIRFDKKISQKTALK